MEVGTILAPWPGRSARLAQRVEALGFASALFTDSQNLAPEVWGQLSLAAAATSTLKLGTGVTNSVTRDAAVNASAALALQVESGGRCILAIGRGDSSVQRIGRAAMHPDAFERYLVQLQAYLSGESVDRDGFESRLEWARAFDVPKVPVEVAATGPRVIEIAARRADAIAFAVGADPDHLARNIERARAAGIEQPIVPGIMPIISANNFQHVSALCGSRVPAKLERQLREVADDDAETMEVGVEWAIQQCGELLSSGAPGIHFYTMNRSPATSVWDCVTAIAY